MITPFDLNTPKDYDGFLKLLAFQTGHRAATHAGAYALEHGFPAKLQPELIDRYLENSQAWHRFTMTRDTDVLDRVPAIAWSQIHETEREHRFSDEMLACNDRAAESKWSYESDAPPPSYYFREDLTYDKHQVVGCKRKRDAGSMSPMSRKIVDMQHQLHALLEDRKHSERRRLEES